MRRLRARRGGARRSAHRATCRSSGCPRSSPPRRSSAAAQVGLHDYVAKFDRQGLIAALKEQTADMESRGVRQAMNAQRRRHRIRHRDDRRPAVRPADLARAGRVHARAADARAARAARDRGPAQSARPHRDGDRHAPAARPAAPPDDGASRMAVGIECKGESYGLLIDAIGEVLKLPASEPRGQSGQSRRAARARLGRRASARRQAAGRARRRSRARHRRTRRRRHECEGL